MDGERDNHYVSLRKKWPGEIFEGLQFRKLSVVEDRLNMMGLLSTKPKTSSFGKTSIFVLTCESKEKGKVFFCDDVSCCISKTL